MNDPTGDYKPSDRVEVQIEQLTGKIWVLGTVRRSLGGYPVVAVQHGRSFIEVTVTDMTTVRRPPAESQA